MTAPVIELGQDEVDELARERAQAEATNQRAAVEAGPVAPAGDGPPPETAAPLPEITPEAHAASIDMLSGLLVTVGGAEVPANTRALAAQLTFPAARKYGGEIPYMVEICGIAGLVLLVRASFTPPPAPAAPAKAAA